MANEGIDYKGFAGDTMYYPLEILTLYPLLGIDCKGFAGDTMHMARLWDTSRDKGTGGGEGYSLEALSRELVDDVRFEKTSMKELFGVSKKLKDGSESKVIYL